MATKSEYVTKMQAQLKRWDADVDALARAGEKAKGKTRAAYVEQVKNLRACSDAAAKSFQAVQAASESAAVQLEAGMEASWEAMQKTLKRVSADLAR